ncbi:MAG TPA: hypothetical protein VM865_03845 [Acidobacteriaceae bacterium]|jgi:hypothetical protein|nr:hypothetical protein [Acidobacteriaceae bacterium]
MLNVHPQTFFVVTLVLLVLGAQLGSYLGRRRGDWTEEESAAYKTIEGSVLALLGLLLGFSFAMGVSRYDLRKSLEVAEANDIGTTWLRTATLAEPERMAEQELLREYVPVRLAFLRAGTSQQRIDESIARAGAMQTRMWAIASGYASTHKDPVTALFLSSLNSTIDVSEERTAALENRIPVSAWLMLLFIGLVSSILVGFETGSRWFVLKLVLPVVVAAALSLTFDLDSSRSGFIRVEQRSMERVAAAVAGSRP